MVFSGRRNAAAGAEGGKLEGGKLRQALGARFRRDLQGDPAQDARFQEHIKESTLAFLEAYLKGNTAAKEWLAGGGFAEALGGQGVWEVK